MPSDKENYVCNLCGKSFTRKSNQLRHERSVHGTDSIDCSICGQRFKRSDKYKNHMKGHQSSEEHIPPKDKSQKDTEICNKPSTTDTNSVQVGSGPTQTEESDPGCITEEEAIDGNLKKIKLESNDVTKLDPWSFLKAKEDAIKSNLRKELIKRKRIKFYLTLQVRFTKRKGEQVEVVEPHFHGRCHVILKEEDLDQAFRESVKKIMNSFLEYQREGSNWALDKVMNVNIHIVKYKPMKGSSYIPLPFKLADKRAIVNPQNQDQKCFMWAILAALFPVHRNPQRVISYACHIDRLDFTGIPFPVRVSDIPKFEKRNSVSINVFGYEHSDIYPLHLTKERGLRHVNLLVLSKGEKLHYCWIKNLNRLMGDQNNDNNQYHYCHYCLHGFTKKRLLDKHIPYCQVHGAQRTEMPKEEDKWLKYTDVSKQLKVPYVIYADFESILEKHYGCQPDPSKSSTIKLAKHVPSGFTYKVVGLTPEATENHVTYRGPDTVKVFVDHMVKLEERLLNVIRNPKRMEMTDEDFQAFQEATHCSICGGELDDDTVRDHCHVTGKFRGASHNSCNLNYQLRERIPVFFHNLRGYDAHHIMSEIGKMKHKRLNCIPQNHEKYISFSLGKLDFVDTFQFMSTSLEKLVNNLSKEGIIKFPHLMSYVAATHPKNQNIKMQLLTRKGDKYG